MRIEVAKNAGACFGVNRALQIAYEAAASGKPASTLGPLIHNPRVVDELEQAGCGVANTLDEADCETLVLRSHGTAPAVIERAESMGFDVVDATCPFVAKVQKQAHTLADEGYAVIIIGEQGHAEVESIRAWGGDAVVAVADAPDKLPDELPERVGVVIQTTQSAQNVDAVLAAVRDRAGEVRVEQTVCAATQKRQASAAELASRADVMIVIGGKNSGNTRRLAEVSSQGCERVHHIESEDELEACWFDDADLVGVTAGASTPQEHIGAVVARLGEMLG